MGSYYVYKVSKNRFNQSEKYCSRTDKKGKCSNWSRRNVRCEKRTAIFSFVPKIINVSTSKVVASESISRQSEQVNCGNSREIKNDDALMNEAMNMVLEYFKSMIAPHYEKEEIVLLSKDDSNPTEQVKQQIDGGIEFAKVGRMERACELWHKAEINHKSGYVIPYLLGVCAESMGNLKRSEYYFYLADKNTDKPVKEINDALSRIEIKKQNKLNLRHLKRSIRPKSSRLLIQVQKNLSGLGYNPGPIDGLMGLKTREAIKTFQRDNRLNITGDLNLQTKQALGLK